MTIDIGIPTFNRREKLGVCIDSLKRAYIPGVNVWVLTSLESERIEYKERYRDTPWVVVEMTDYSKVSTCWNEFVAASTADALLFLCDDTSLDDECLANAVDCMEDKFPDGDGVIGLNVTNYPPSWPEAITQYGFRLVGRKFHARYPVGQAYCPEYYRFYVDTEMGEYSKETGRFAFCPGAKLQHFHPNAPGGTLDDTHFHNRGDKQIWDNEIWKARQAAGYLWGRNFDLVRVR